MMMTIMPLVMTVMFYQFPSGLVLYWMMSNLLAIGHQLWIGRNMQPAPEGGDSNGKQAKAKAKAA
jgi:YidC/Oxa1 family membrane protein insertase